MNVFILLKKTSNLFPVHGKLTNLLRETMSSSLSVLFFLFDPNQIIPLDDDDVKKALAAISSDLKGLASHWLHHIIISTVYIIVLNSMEKRYTVQCTYVILS